MLQIYRPLLQDPNLNMTIVLRSSTALAGVERTAAVLHRLDKGVPLIH